MFPCAFLQPTASRPAPHRTAWHRSAQPPRTRTRPPPITTSAGDAAPITLLEARPHHRSHGLGARGTAWRVASLAWGSSARGTGKRAHDARDATRKSGDGGAGAWWWKQRSRSGVCCAQGLHGLSARSAAFDRRLLRGGISGFRVLGGPLSASGQGEGDSGGGG
jgi:hypothetical protein